MYLLHLLVGDLRAKRIRLRSVGPEELVAKRLNLALNMFNPVVF